MKKTMLAAVFAVAATNAAVAAPITITGYDIANAQVSGSGGWAHSYTGTIATVSGSVANYSGGSGTLNNGIVETNEQSTQLFNYPSNSSPVITLFLDGFYSINSLLISGGNFLNNTIPGELYGLDLSINGVTASFTTTAQGFSQNGRFADDLVTVNGSALAGLVTNQIVLSGFDSRWGNNVFSIAEIQVDGTPGSSSVPAPHALALLGLALAAVGFSRKQKAA